MFFFFQLTFWEVQHWLETRVYSSTYTGVMCNVAWSLRFLTSTIQHWQYLHHDVDMRLELISRNVGENKNPFSIAGTYVGHELQWCSLNSQVLVWANSICTVMRRRGWHPEVISFWSVHQWAVFFTRIRQSGPLSCSRWPAKFLKVAGQVSQGSRPICSLTVLVESSTRCHTGGVFWLWNCVQE